MDILGRAPTHPGKQVLRRGVGNRLASVGEAVRHRTESLPAHAELGQCRKPMALFGSTQLEGEFQRVCRVG